MIEIRTFSCPEEIRELPNFIEENRLLNLEPIFFANNFFPLCFQESEKSERYKAARISMHRSGVAGSNDEAKAWLAAQQKAIKQQVGIDMIEIR